MKRIDFTERNCDTQIVDSWECEERIMWKLETAHEGIVPVNKMKMIKFLEAQGITEIAIEEAKALFITEYRKEERVKIAIPVESETYTIDADGDMIVINRKKQAESEAKRIAQAQEQIKKQKIENIMFDNESEGIDPMNGIWR